MKRHSISKAIIVLLTSGTVSGFVPLHQPQQIIGNPRSLAATSQNSLLSSSNLNSRLMMKATELGSEPQDTPPRLKNPEPVLAKLFQNWRTNESSTSAMLMAGLVFALTMMPLPSDAAMSGGRMGGSFAASPAPTTRSMPSSSSRGYGSRSRSYSYTRGSYYATPRPSVTIAPSVGYGYGYGLNPFGGGYYGGGPGVIAVSRGPSFFDLIFWGGLLFALTNVFRDVASGGADIGTSFLGDDTVTSALGPGTSVAQVTVALQVPQRDDPNSILSVLRKLSQTAKTNKRLGIQQLTSQVALEVLRRKSSIVSASSSYKHYRNSSKAQQDYQAKAIRERSKFETETVSKFGGVDYSSKIQSTSSNNDNATMAVVTLLLEIQGDSTSLPRISSLSDAEEALRTIASDSLVSDCLQSVEILWTPEDRSETLSLRDVVADYPELRSV